MSNTRQLEIFGTVPFNTYEYPELNEYLGQLNGPSFGFRIQYEGTAGSVANEFGGRTLYYKFRIFGQEAVRTTWVDGLVKAIMGCRGTINFINEIDVDDGNRVLLHRKGEHAQKWAMSLCKEPSNGT